MSSGIENSLSTIQEYISRGKISSISFTISDSYNPENNMPVIDFSVEDENGNNLLSDLEFDDICDVINEIAIGLEKSK